MDEILRKFLVIATATLACRSSAPYTIPSAVLNTGLALGASAQQRSQGDCFAVCTNGTVCNPRTGFCERELFACTHGAPGCPPDEWAPLNVDQLFAPPALTPGSSVGVSPATGRVPPPPGSPQPGTDDLDR